MTETVQLPPTAMEDPQVLVSAKSPLVPTPVTAIGAALALVTVTVWLELALPRATTPKFNALADNVTGVPPVPLRLTFWGLFEALSVKVSVPLAAPAAVGVNVTPTAQLAPAGTGVPQVLPEIAKGPLIPTLEIVRDVLWRLVSVTVTAALVLPTVTVPKLNELADSVTGELEPLPVPLRLTVWGPPGAESVKVSVPVAAPVAVGVKVTPTLQLAPGAMLVPQVLPAIPKGPLAPTPEMVSDTPRLLVSVTDLVELVEPTAVVLKLRELADSVTGAVPVPVRLTICGLLIALSAKLRVPVAPPSAVGVKVTPTVQVAPAAILVPHVLLAMAKGLPVEMEIPVSVSAVLSLLVIVTVFAMLVPPTASEPKLRLLEENVTGALPLPVTVTVCVPALSAIVRTPETEPTTVGEKTTAMVHDAAGATLPLHVFVWLNGPVTATPVTWSGPVPELCTVTFFAVLEFPMTSDEKESDVGVTVAACVVPVPFSASVCAGPRL
jgi:hypothetical protein